MLAFPFECIEGVQGVQGAAEPINWDKDEEPRMSLCSWLLQSHPGPPETQVGSSLRWKRHRSPSPAASAEPLKYCRSVTRWGHLEQYVAAVAMARGNAQMTAWSSMLSGRLPRSFNPPLPFQMRGSDGHLITVGSLPNAKLGKRTQTNNNSNKASKTT